jgi:hypothetical protein
MRSPECLNRTCVGTEFGNMALEIKIPNEQRFVKVDAEVCLNCGMIQLYSAHPNLKASKEN